ncbi:MAG TPA: transglycosylase SLT domain-containing protein [Longimicrobiales bacterium]|nr:transglycosylase SLT domain-containing protein [Longimicrobiales bacterium]
MTRRALYGALTIVVLAVVVTTLLLARTSGGDDTGAPQGEVAREVQALDLDDMPERAEAFLATDRPWRASMVMRTYLERVSDALPEHRVLAARAEAGWGGWDRVVALLRGVQALETYDNGIGGYLLARAMDEAGDARAAVDGYNAFLALSPPAGEMQAERAAARLRLALALMRAGDRAAGQQQLAAVRADAPAAGVWLDLLQADALAESGDTAAVRAAVAAHADGIPGLHAWRARIRAASQAGDHAQARALANRARAWARTDATRAEFLLSASQEALAMRDTPAGRAGLRSVMEMNAAGPAARAAATELVALGGLTPTEALAVSRVYRAQGLHEESLDGYRRWLAAGQGTAAERTAIQLEYADALFYALRYDEVAAALQPVRSETAAQSLLARTEAHLGNAEAAARIYLRVAAANAGNANGVQALYLAASAWHDANELDRAAELYRRVIREYPGRSQMGLAMMRLAGIHFIRGEHAAARELWDDYRRRYPRGTHAVEATYWAGRAREAAGDSAGAAVLFRAVRDADRESYHALRASQRLGVPFWPLPMSPMPAADAAADRRVATWMRGIDLLRNAGFHDAASAEADRIVAAAGSDRATRYALAEALVERGYSQRALRLGNALRGNQPPDRRLLQILYPFPFRTLISEEARDRGFDPFVAAALIRQESMFEARITSPAGARGLMQVMPATGRTLAQSAGVHPWDGELLYQPEINVHLGTRYVAQHLETYDGSLPSVFSAYNAGYHRVDWWKNFREYEDEELFTERIPFRETRDYVRILTRNLAIYRGLYGS